MDKKDLETLKNVCYELGYYSPFDEYSVHEGYNSLDSIVDIYIRNLDDKVRNINNILGLASISLHALEEALEIIAKYKIDPKRLKFHKSNYEPLFKSCEIIRIRPNIPKYFIYCVKFCLKSKKFRKFLIENYDYLRYITKCSFITKDPKLHILYKDLAENMENINIQFHFMTIGGEPFRVLSKYLENKYNILYMVKKYSDYIEFEKELKEDEIDSALDLIHEYNNSAYIVHNQNDSDEMLSKDVIVLAKILYYNGMCDYEPNNLKDIHKEILRDELKKLYCRKKSARK